jgi:hypothetical protein
MTNEAVRQAPMLIAPHLTSSSPPNVEVAAIRSPEWLQAIAGAFGLHTVHVPFLGAIDSGGDQAKLDAHRNDENPLFVKPQGAENPGVSFLPF